MTLKVDGLGAANAALGSFDDHTVNQANQAQVAAETGNGGLAGVSPNLLLASMSGVDRAAMMRAELLERTSNGFDFNLIEGVRHNPNVTSEFIQEVVAMSQRLGTRPEWLLAVMSFETGGTFSPAVRNPLSGATGLIQFIPETARLLRTSTDALARMTPVEQLRYVERYLAPFKGRLNTLEGVYTAVLSGSPRPDPRTVLFRQGTNAYAQNRGLDLNNDGLITSGEATAQVAARLFGGVERVQQRLIDLGLLRIERPTGYYGPMTFAAIEEFQRRQGLSATGLLDDATGRALFAMRKPELEPPAPPKIDSPMPSGNLARGDRGPEVTKLQGLLVDLGHMTREQVATGPGIFGPRTEAAVREFQRANGLVVTGKFDAATHQAMSRIVSGVRRGDRGPLVAALQQRLVGLGYMTEAEVNTGPGIFGPRTEAALKRFQAANGITQTGVLGVTTYRAFQKAASGKTAPEKAVPEKITPAGDGARSSLPYGRPVDAPITSGYGVRTHPIYKVRRFHTGIDFGASAGTPARTTGSGRVAFAGRRGGYGNLVIVDHGNGYLTYYAHLSRINVSRGQTVTKGQVVGAVGQTGLATGPHLHYEIRRSSGEIIDPTPFLDRR
ncbi:MAG: hypothetical protein C4334_14170 [Pyrinomonas sp.]|uniref:peptidoglycan-binding protein n=1 Tax=Pyrinomonas sp. TaxID=2080306 RepID=UPI0033333927